jgi:hypothetical protein
MQNNYTLKNALTFNPTGKKYNAIASVATLKEIRQHKEYFEFDFEKLLKGSTVYKICKQGYEDIIQGLVAVRPSKGILDCANMEINKINKAPLSLHNGIGKSIIALCCKISFDLGFEGFICFEAKNRLMKYYKRYGAQNISGLRMFIDTENAEKLVDLYFEND